MVGFLKKLFSGKKQDTSHEMLVRKVIELEAMFSGDILENPKSVDIDAEGYKGMCYARCEQYQDKIEKAYNEIKHLLTQNDGTIPPEKEQYVRKFIGNMFTCVHNAAQEFFKILDQGDGESNEVKEKFNEKSYQYSVTMRWQFREQVKGLREKI